MVRIEAFLAGWHGLPGRPPCERAVLAGAFIAKAVFNIPTTSLLIEMLSADKTLRRLCGWQRADAGAEQVDVFAGFRGVRRRRFAIAVARGADPRHPFGSFGRTYLVTARRSRRVKNRRNQTSRQRNQNPNLSVAVPAGELRPPPPPSRIERQRGMTLAAMLADLPGPAMWAPNAMPRVQETWISSPSPVDTADGEIPISCVLTAASVHDSQVAIPLPPSPPGGSPISMT